MPSTVYASTLATLLTLDSQSRVITATTANAKKGTCCATQPTQKITRASPLLRYLLLRLPHHRRLHIHAPLASIAATRCMVSVLPTVAKVRVPRRDTLRTSTVVLGIASVSQAIFGVSHRRVIRTIRVLIQQHRRHHLQLHRPHLQPTIQHRHQLILLQGSRQRRPQRHPPKRHQKRLLDRLLRCQQRHQRLRRRRRQLKSQPRHLRSRPRKRRLEAPLQHPPHSLQLCQLRHQLQLRLIPPRSGQQHCLLKLLPRLHLMLQLAYLRLSLLLFQQRLQRQSILVILAHISVMSSSDFA